MRRPTDFTVRDGATAPIQDVTEGKFPITVNKQKGVDFKFTSADLTLKIDDLSERVMKPATGAARQPDRCRPVALYKSVLELGRHGPGQSRSQAAFADFAKGPERLDQLGGAAGRALGRAVADRPLGACSARRPRCSCRTRRKDAYRRAKLGMIGNVDTYMAQNVQTHHRLGARRPARRWSTARNQTSPTTAKDSNTAASRSSPTAGRQPTTLKEGDVFTIANVFAVNPVTKATQEYLQQFVVRADATRRRHRGG